MRSSQSPSGEPERQQEYQPCAGPSGQPGFSPQGYSPPPRPAPSQPEPSWSSSGDSAVYAAEPAGRDEPPPGVRSATKSVAIVTVVLAVSSIGMSIMGFVVLALLPAGFLPMAMTSGSAYVPMILGGLAGMFVGASGVTFGLRLRLSLYLCAMALVLNVANAVVGSTMVPYTPAMYFGVVIIHLPLVVGLLPKVRPWLRPVGGRARQVRRAGSPSQAWS